MKLNVIKVQLFTGITPEELENQLNAFFQNPTAPDGSALPEAEFIELQYYIAGTDAYGPEFTCMVIYA